MGAANNDGRLLSRRGFIGWGGVVLTAAAVPGFTLWLTEAPAGAATLAPYALSSWRSLLQRSVQAAMPGTSSGTLKVVGVTDRAVTTARKMTGEVFSIGFQASRPWRPGLYIVTASGLGSFPLYLDGGGRTASALINRRVPA